MPHQTPGPWEAVRVFARKLCNSQLREIGRKIAAGVFAHDGKQRPGIRRGETVAQGLIHKGGKDPIHIPVSDGIAQQVNVCAVPLHMRKSAGGQGLRYYGLHQTVCKDAVGFHNAPQVPVTRGGQGTVAAEKVHFTRFP